MSGIIDPLLPGDDPSDARAATPLDVTALFELHRVGLTRVALAITLERVLADEVVRAALLDLQRHIGGVDDPARQLLRSVVVMATSRGADAGKGLHARGRRKVVTRRPERVAPRWQAPEHGSVWEAFGAMSRAQRAVLVLAHWRHLSERDISDLLGWPRRRVVAHLRAARAEIARAAPAGADPDLCAAGMLDAALPQLLPGDEPSGEGQLDLTPTGRTTLRLLVPKEPKPHRLAWAAAALALAALVVGTVALLSRQQADLLPVTEMTAPEPAARVQPGWYSLLRPHVPERFDRLALVALDAERIGYLAIETDTGRSLDIEIVRRAVPDATVAVDAVIEIPDGVRVVRLDGTSVEVSCELCGSEAGPGASDPPPDVRAIAAEIAAGFEVSDVGSSFGSPSVWRTDVDDVAGAVAAAMPGAIDVPVIEHTGSDDRGAVTSLSARTAAGDATMAVLVVHGVFPTPTDVVRPPLTSFEGGILAGWVVDEDGTATRVVATGSGFRPGPEAAPIESLLDALGDIPASTA